MADPVSARQDPAALAALYEDEFDDSLELFSAEGRTDGPALAEDMEDANQAVRRGGQGGSAAAALFSSGGARSNELDRSATESGSLGSSKASAPAVTSRQSSGLPSTALEWVRSIGLGQYVDAFRTAGFVRLEVAAKLADSDLTRLKITSVPHRTKLLASAARLAERLRERGRLSAPGVRGGGAEAYTAATEIHYDAETGQFWGEDGSFDASSTSIQDATFAGQGTLSTGANVQGHKGKGASGKSGKGSGSGRPPPPVGVQRARAEANKARLGNHSRKQGAMRKQAQTGGF